MRAICLFLVVAVACCNWTAASDSSTSGTGGSSSCPQTSACADCKTCALNGGCASLWSACEQSSDCQAIDQCWATCAVGDTSCQQNCYADDSDAMATYAAVNNCVYCTECTTACAGQCSN